MKSITGWNIVDPAMPAMEPHAKGHANVGSTDGNHYMDLGASPGNSAIYQDISGLIVGGTYRFSVDYRDKAAMQESGQSGLDSGVMEILLNGVAVATVQGNNTLAWETLTLDLVAQNGANRLTFNEIGVADDNWGIAIDNVQLKGVTYSYDLSVNATLSDSSESLGNVELGALPANSQILGGTSIDVDSGVTKVVTLETHSSLSVEQINAISGSVTSTDGTSVATTVEHTVATINEVGADKLVLPTNDDIDFSMLASINNPFKDIEVIDLATNGNHKLTNLSLADIIDMTDSNHTLTILGDAGDSVNIPAVSGNYAVTKTIVSGFDVYTYSHAGDPTVIVKIDQDIQHS